MVVSKKVQAVIDHCAETGIEIVSHGLAPNPNGFCYELPNRIAKAKVQKLDKLLNSLSKAEEQQLIVNTF